MSIDINDTLRTRRRALLVQFEDYTADLTALTVHGTGAAHDGLDPYTVAARVESTRQALADTTEALKRIDDGTYGRCQRCHHDIPAERLEILPHARFCVPCQQVRRG